jgi:hypothetical protein
MNERESLLTELHADELLYSCARQQGDWETAQACAELLMNLARRLHLLELQEKSELDAKA